MLLRWLLASIHLLALGIGLGAVWARAQALRGPLDRDGMRRVFAADHWWAVAAGLWIATGVWRMLGGFEKGTTYYLQSHIFMTKMALMVVILILEIWPMSGLIRWRMALKRGETPEVAPAARWATISVVQAALVLAMVLFATAIARGVGIR